MELDEETLNKILGEIIHKAAETVKVELQLRGLDQLLAVTMDIEFTVSPSPRRCGHCIHPAHRGMCTGRNGGTAHPCPCFHSSGGLEAPPEPAPRAQAVIDADYTVEDTQDGN